MNISQPRCLIHAAALTLALIAVASRAQAQDTTRAAVTRIDFQDAELRAVITAIAEAGAIRAINAAAQEAQNNPLLLQLKALEVEKARVEKWDGRYPQWWMAGNGASGGPNLQFQVPLPTANK